MPKRIEIVCALDVSYSKESGVFVGGAVVVDYKTGRVIEKKAASGDAAFPYVPGLLSFREGPILCDVLSQIESPVDALLCDGQGMAHPRRFGIASHMGVLFDIPSVGCGKSRLCGEHKEPGAKKRSSTHLVMDGEVIGRVVRMRDNVKPVYISVGHRADIDGAVKFALGLATKYRLPDPIRFAHGLVNRVRVQREGRIQGKSSVVIPSEASEGGEVEESLNRSMRKGRDSSASRC